MALDTQVRTAATQIAPVVEGAGAGKESGLARFARGYLDAPQTKENRNE